MESYIATVDGEHRQDAITRAQNIMYAAWDRATSRSRVSLARKALGISPLCADAYNLLAAEAATTAEARDLYTRGLEAGEFALGPEDFGEYDGHFWGVLKTRPYMRARHGLALTLIAQGEEEAAIEHCRAMLKLNPVDNQGIRYLLLGVLLRRDDFPAAQTLLAAYADEWSAHWLYTHALLAYREGPGSTPATTDLLKDALSANAHVPAMLADAKPPLIAKTDYVTVGGPEEAAEYVRECGAAWRKTPGAVEWLAIAIADLAAPKAAH